MEKASLPLAGKRVVITRTRDQAREWINRLEKLGATVLVLPMIAFALPEDWQPLDTALRNLSRFDWLLFTSANAVGFFCRRWRELGVIHNSSGALKPRIAAVGSATANAAAREGLHVDYIAKENNGEALAAELEMHEPLSEKSILLPRSDRADNRLPDALRKTNANVTDIIAYRTVAPESVDSQLMAQVRGAQIDAVLFGSPSAFNNFARILGSNEEVTALSQQIAFAAIGPTTARVLRDAGVCVAIEAPEPSAASFGDAICKHFEHPSSTGRIA